MSREQFNFEKEHSVVGTYPAIRGMQVGGHKKGEFTHVPEAPRFYRPIETRENFKMLFQGKTPYWIPHCGWFFCDVNEFRPRQHPDNMANHQCMDGGGPVDYEALGNLCIGWLGLPLEWEALSQGATVRPGNPILDDINDWEEKVVFPDLNQINWREMAEMNKDYLGTDKPNQLGIQFGLWERLMSLMDVNNAALALVDEDQEEEMIRFLDKLSDLYVDYINRVADVCRIESVMFHDDWGTQNGPFFSLDVARQFFVAPMKKIVDCCHARGIIFEHHSCGNASKLVPAMIDAGVDYWLPQSSCNNVDDLIEQYKDAPITFAVNSPMLTRGSSVETVREIAKAWVEKYKDKGILLCHDITLGNHPEYDADLFPIFADAVYEFSRIAYQNAED